MDHSITTRSTQILCAACSEMGESFGGTQVKHVYQHELLQAVEGTAWYKRGAASSSNFQLTNQSAGDREFRVQRAWDLGLWSIANRNETDTD